MSNFRVPYLVGDKFGRDHQLWPTLTKEQFWGLGLSSNTVVGNYARGLSFPIAMTLAQIQVMSWRVREWKIEASTWTASSAVFFEPVVSQDDIAQINDSGSTPEFAFRYRRQTDPSFDPIDIANEKEIVARWDNQHLKGDNAPPNYTVPIWKTLRNLGVRGFSNGIDDTDVIAAALPSQITGAFTFTEPYSHVKFGEGGSFIGGKLLINTMFGYILYDPDTQLFYPPIAIGATLPTLRAERVGVDFILLPLSPPPLPPPEEGFQTPIPCGFLTVSFGASGLDSVQCQIIRYPYSVPFPSGTGLIVPATTGSFNLTMTPKKWWPYKNSLGQAVYDVNDGHQIHDPYA